MKLVGTKEKGYKMVSSFEKPAKKPGNEKTMPVKESEGSGKGKNN